VAKVNWTDEARRWLQEIYDYIATDNPDAAYRTVSEIHEKAGLLGQFPEMGSLYRGDRKVRILLSGQYRIAYVIKPPTDIDVIGVFHGALDIDRYLR
jgi:plasmid stabilization system protein ParE